MSYRAFPGRGGRCAKVCVARVLWVWLGGAVVTVARYLVTWWASVTQTASGFQVASVTWDELVARLSVFARVATKTAAPLWTPYGVAPPAQPCTKHGTAGTAGVGVAAPVRGPHRCDACVSSVSLLVYDVDQGAEADVLATRQALTTAGITHHGYSTYSHSPAHPAYRLVIPLVAPVGPSDFRSVRLAVLRRFLIPADVSACSGLSHGYFVPSAPAGASATAAPPPVVFSFSGTALDPAAYAAPAPGPVSARRVSATPVAWSPTPDPDPSAPLDLEPYWVAIRDRIGSLSRKTDVASKARAALLGRLVRGEALADHGNRNTTTTRVAGVLAYMFPEAPVAVLRAIMRPSVTRMQAAGSKLTWDAVDRMLLTGLHSAAQAKADREEFDRRVQAILRLWTTPKAAGSTTADGGGA